MSSCRSLAAAAPVRARAADKGSDESWERLALALPVDAETIELVPVDGRVELDLLDPRRLDDDVVGRARIGRDRLLGLVVGGVIAGGREKPPAERPERQHA